MSTLESPPWQRVKNPTAIPAALTVTGLRRLDSDEFTALVRDNLLLRSEDQRRAWQTLWALLAADDDLSDRTYDVLDQLLDQTEDALELGDLDEAAARRATKFRASCEAAWNRLGRLDRARRGPERTGERLARLAAAVDEHRRRTPRPTAADQQLYATLDELYAGGAPAPGPDPL